jgi:AraC-like DNA-binding protein/ligand-binding sensor protein
MKSILKYIFQKEVLEIFDLFTDLFDIRIAFFTSQGEELKVGKSKPLCRFCQLLRKHLNYEQVCLTLDKKMRDQAVQQKKLIHYKCHGGMTEAIYPIFMEEQLIGFVMIGQFRTANEKLNRSIRKKWKEQVGTDDLEEAFKQTPDYSKEYSISILKLFSILVDHILYRHMIELYGSTSVQPLISFLQGHFEERLNLEEAADITFQSRSGLSQKFRRVTGKSFKQFQIELKLNKADEYFKKKPDMTIKEVSFRLGYHDPYYFSRLYKKHRGRPPSQARQQWHKNRT